MKPYCGYLNPGAGNHKYFFVCLFFPKSGLEKIQRLIKVSLQKNWRSFFFHDPKFPKGKNCNMCACTFTIWLDQLPTLELVVILAHMFWLFSVDKSGERKKWFCSETKFFKLASIFLLSSTWKDKNKNKDKKRVDIIIILSPFGHP